MNVLYKMTMILTFTNSFLHKGGIKAWINKKKHQKNTKNLLTVKNVLSEMTMILTFANFFVH